MAKYDAGYLSPISNKLGNAVGRRWRGIPVLSVYNGNPRNPRTTAQQIQRAKLTKLSTLAKSFAAALNMGLMLYCKNKPQFPRAYFVGKNMRAVSATTPSNVVIDWERLLFADGPVYTPTAGAPHNDTPGEIYADVQSSALAALPNYAAGDFKAYLVLYSVDAGMAIVGAGQSLDIDAKCTATCAAPATWNGLSVKVYAFLVAQNEKHTAYGINTGEASQNIYVGNSTIE